jgi:thiamine-monophosphate kinase
MSTREGKYLGYKCRVIGYVRLDKLPFWDEVTKVPQALFRYHVWALPLPERALISRIRSEAQRRAAHLGVSKKQVVAGIGDDCSVLRVPKNHEILVTTDFSLEGVHFRREWHPPESVGHRCLARGLSDIAAMGGEPLAAFLSLSLPAKLPQKWVDQFMKGLLKLAAHFDVPLAGGDTSESPAGVLADIVVVGAVPIKKAILRSGARPGDRIYVSGALGGSEAALDLLDSKRPKELEAGLFRRHFFPVPRISVGRILRQKAIAVSMIDLSDGLSTDLGHICQESGMGAEVWAESVPRAVIGRPAHQVELGFALHGGEDYELLFTARRGTRVPGKIAGVRISEIGSITRDQRRVLVGPRGARAEFQPRGWEHFRKHFS